MSILGCGSMFRHCNICLEQSPQLDQHGKIEVCPKCKKEIEEASENAGKPLHQIEPRSPHPLCTQCGVCCFMLVAKVKTEEVEAMSEHFGDPFDSIGEKCGDEVHTTLNFPCHYLVGRPLKYVRCSAYGSGKRPEVCRSYMCKIAIMYSLRSLSLGESLFHMRRGFINRDHTVFNWGSDRMGDLQLQIAHTVVNGIDQLKKNVGLDSKTAGFIAAEALTRRWDFRSDEDHSLFSMYVEQASKGDFDPSFYVPEDEFNLMNEDQKEFARRIIFHVMDVIMDCVSPVPSAIQRAFEDDPAKTVEYPIHKLKKDAQQVEKVGSVRHLPFQVSPEHKRMQELYESALAVNRKLQKQNEELIYRVVNALRGIADPKEELNSLAERVDWIEQELGKALEEEE